MPAKFVLTYWPVQGLGNPLRLAVMAAFKDGEFELKEISSPDQTAELATKSGNVFHNMPYLQTPTVGISQSNAILRHIGRVGGLLGTTPEEQAAVDELIETFGDYRKEKMKTAYECKKEEFESTKKSFFDNTVPYYLGGLDKMLTAGGSRAGKFAAGTAKATVADFLLFVELEQLALLDGKKTTPEILASMPALKDLHSRLLQEPAVKKYMASPYAKMPCNGPDAHWSPMVMPSA